jgi:hypothetical protein
MGKRQEENTPPNMDMKIGIESVHWIWCTISGVLNALTILQYINNILINILYNFKINFYILKKIHKKLIPKDNIFIFKIFM